MAFFSFIYFLILLLYLFEFLSRRYSMQPSFCGGGDSDGYLAVLLLLEAFSQAVTLPAGAKK